MIMKRYALCFLIILLQNLRPNLQPNTSRDSIYVRPFHQLLQLQQNDDLREFQIIPEEHYLKRSLTETTTNTLFMVYMAADNNLHYFAWNNIKQLATIGSNANITIVVQLNEPGNNKKTQRYLIEKNKAILLNQDQVASGKKFNTGDPKTLIDFCTSTIKRFPTKYTTLVLWDHGTGYLDPLKVKTANIHELFELNPADMMLELNRNYEFMERIDSDGAYKGICFDETYHSYLSNQKLDYALKTICQETNRKIDIIGLDACMMQMLEVGELLQPYAHYMVGSQEVELGAGWNYKHILKPFEDQALAPDALAKQIVQCYQQTYGRITHDFTLSAADLSYLPALVQNINTVGSLLLECLKNQKDQAVKNTILQCRAKKNCTCFDEPSYIDLGHFYLNLQANLDKLKINNTQTITALKNALTNGLNILSTMIIANVSGKNLKKALGLSIYLPEKRIHSSYPNTPFASKNTWAHLVQEFILRGDELIIS